MQRFHPSTPKAVGQFVDAETNVVEALQRQLRRTKPGEVFVKQRLRWMAADRSWSIEAWWLAQHSFVIPGCGAA